MKRILLVISLILISIGTASATQCSGKMINPITDVCWQCVLPISIGAIPVAPGKTADTENFPSPICICPMPPPEYYRVGLAVGFWEPIRLADVTKEPFCFVGIGGQKMNVGVDVGVGSDPENGSGTELDPATWHVHWYLYPVFSMISSELDEICVESTESFDMAYVTEFDPLWLDDELSFIIAPESILFGNLIAQAACAADCLASSFSLPIDALFWCSGCQGGMYPTNGKIISHNTSIQSSELAVSRMLYKLHRELFLPITSGPDVICSPRPSAMIKKSQYRTQLTNPVATVDPQTGCNPLGRSTFFWETSKEIPVIGEDFNYLIWRKRNCCAS
jgi:conjugal transfer pilus assembly protein TraU